MATKKTKAKGIASRLSTIFLVIASILAIIYLYYSSLDIAIRWTAAILILFIVGNMIAKMNRFSNLYGMYMLGSRHGISVIESLAATKPGFWKFIADWGLAAGFGLFSYFIFRKRVGLRMVLFGSVSVVLIMALAVPFMAASFSFINIPQINSRIAAAQAAPAAPSIYSYAIYAISFIGGFVLFIFYSIIYNAASILYGIAAYLVSPTAANTALLSSQVPGVAPLIPGITIPIFAGILSLALILIVHEFSHGVLSKLSKIKIKSIGLVIFGIIPMGAYVEPDERAIKRLKPLDQNRIFAAGIAMNVLFAIIFSAILAFMIFYVMPNFTQSSVIVSAVLNGSPAYNVIAPGSIVLSWNGYQTHNITALEKAASLDRPYSTVNLVTDKGTYKIQAASDGKIGVDLVQETGPTGSLLSQAIYFIYTFVALSAILNFLIGVVNLLPLPGFDGWRIFQTSIKSRRTVNAIAIIAVIAILINVLPWIWEA